MSDIQTYFICDAKRSRVKIGKSVDPYARLASLQIGSAQALSVVLVLDGDRERELQRRFGSYRLRGEWFTFGDDIAQFVAECNGVPWKRPFLSWLLDCRFIAKPNDFGKLAFYILKNPKHNDYCHRLPDDIVKWRKYFAQFPAPWPLVLERAHLAWRRDFFSPKAHTSDTDLAIDETRRCVEAVRGVRRVLSLVGTRTDAGHR